MYLIDRVTLVGAKVMTACQWSFSCPHLRPCKGLWLGSVGVVVGLVVGAGDRCMLFYTGKWGWFYLAKVSHRSADRAH